MDGFALPGDMRRIAILAASGRELAPARGVLGTVQRSRLGSLVHEVGRIGGVEAHLVVSGIGAAPAFAAAEALLAAVRVDAVVSTGYAGALGAAEIGEVIVGTEVYDWTKTQPRPVYRSDGALLDMARRAVGPARTAWSQGAVVTVGQIVWRAAEKRALGKASGAIAVEMESAAIAHAAASRKVPFLMVRAVSDGVDDDLPMDFNLWLQRWGRTRGIAQLLMRPSRLRALLTMKRHVEQGSYALAQFFRAFFAVLDEGGVPADALAVATGGRY